ncbi:MAG: ATP-binding protein [Candidatus Njordarchaeota archaeon]
MANIKTKILDNKFIVIIDRGRVFKSAMVISQIFRYATNQAFNTESYIAILRNTIMRLDEIGGKFFIILYKKHDAIKCYLLLHFMSVRSGKLKNTIRKAIAYLKNLITISGSHFAILNKESIKDILKILSNKTIVTRQIRKMEILLSKEIRISSLLKMLPEGFLIERSLKNIHNFQQYSFPLQLIQNNQFIIFGLDLNSIKQAIIRTHPKPRIVSHIPNRNTIMKNIEPNIFTEDVTIRIALLFGQELSNISALKSDIHNKLEQLINMPFSFLPYRINNKKIRNLEPEITTIFDIIFGDSFNITLKSNLNIALYFVVMLFHILISTKKRKIGVPELDICEEVTRGHIHIGWQLKYGEPTSPFYLKLSDIQRHILIIGRTGMGKSRLARAIIEGILNNSHSKVWIFDFHREYIDFIHRHEFLLYIPGTEDFPLMINIFESSNEDRESYSSFLTSLLLETIKLRGEEISAQMERALSYAVWSTVTGQNPNPRSFLNNLMNWCKEVESDIPTAFYTFYAVTNRLKSIFSGTSKNIFWVRKSNINIGNLKKKNVVFDLSFLFKRNLKREILLLVNIIFRYVVMNMFQEGINTTETPRLCLVIEEGRYLMPWRRIESSVETTAIEDFATLSRKYGLGLIVISQSPFTISPDIISNAGTLFMMNAEIPEHEHIIINDENLKRYIQIMPPRETVVRLTSHPTLIHVKIKKIKTHNINNIILNKKPTEHIDSYIIDTPFEEYIKKILIAK